MNAGKNIADVAKHIREVQRMIYEQARDTAEGLELIALEDIATALEPAVEKAEMYVGKYALGDK